MIHYTCDACRRAIDTDSEPRYVVRLEVYAAVDEDGDRLADDADHLQEIEDLLDGVEDLDGDDADPTLYKQVRYDLCEACRERFLSNPFGRNVGRSIGFSKN